MLTRPDTRPAARSKAQKLYDTGLKAEAAGKYPAAAKAYADCLKLEPHVPEVANNLGHALLRLGKVDQARTALRRADQLRPDQPVILGNLADCARATGEHHLAVEYLEKRLKLQFDMDAARILIGLLRRLNRREDALKLATRTVAETGATLVDRTHLMMIAREQCDWDLAEAAEADLGRRLDDDQGYAGSPFRFYASSDDPLCLLNIARRAAAKLGEGARRPKMPPLDGKLRLGFISQDFRDHPMLKLIAGMLQSFDPETFEIFLYAPGADSDDPRRAEISAAATRFRTFRAEPAERIAADIRRNELHALVDLMGFTRDARPDVLALRPAATQISWLGLPGTSGAPWIDYVIADDVVIPKGAEAGFSETVARIEPTYYPFDDRSIRPAPCSRTEAGLPEGQGVVFGSFNQSFKFDRMRFASWCTILNQTPDSLLWLLDPGEEATARLRAAMSGNGVDPERLIIAPTLPHEAHCKRLGAADVMLDTWLYGGHTTTIEALWLGVPVVTRIGETFSARVAASILTAAGLEELIAESESEYQEIALRLCLDAGFASRIREKISKLSADQPPFATARFAGAFGELIRQIVERETGAI